ncbi:MAG: mechanosensitive ion channel [Gammaproteobacteria bacterium]|nr:mechanosensitive ion channel [Gammaproteobacteria bacterium]
MDEIKSIAEEYGRLAWDLLNEPAVLIQLVFIAAMLLPALFLARYVEPKLEGRAREIKGMPGLLRVIVAFLRRLQWLFFVILLGIAYLATSVAAWPASNYLIYSAMLLSGAWLLITLVSHVIRRRVIGRAFAIATWIYVAMVILGITDDAAAILDRAAFDIGTFRISILGVIEATVFLGVLLLISLNVGNFLDRRIQRIDELTPSLRVLIGKILRIVIILLAFLVAMSGLGIDLTALTVLSGAVGVGIGFGLQKVVSNFISGIIILMDESIKPGDTISLGDTFGWIRELRARFVSVITRDGREFLIPNEDFITREVINWSFSDSYVRLDVPFGVSYDSDPHEVSRLAIEAAASVGRVDSTRTQPVCWLTAFGDSSLDFLLRFWIRDPQQGLTNIRGKVLLALWDTFKEHGITIPYPHREVIFKTPAGAEELRGQSP